MTNEIIKVDGDLLSLTEDAQADIINLTKTIELAKTALDDIKARLLEEMREQNVIKITTDDLVISYIAPTDRETFDSKKFRSANPDLYDEYVSFKPVKESIRIKVN